MERPPPRSTPPDTLFPSTTLLRSDAAPADRAQHHPISQVDHHHALSRPTSTCGRGARDLPVARHLHHVAHRHLVIVCIRHSLYAVGVRKPGAGITSTRCTSLALGSERPLRW